MSAPPAPPPAAPRTRPGSAPRAAAAAAGSESSSGSAGLSGKTATGGETSQNQLELSLTDCIVKGLKEQSYKATIETLKTKDAMAVINEELVPALDIVGKGFQAGRDQGADTGAETEKSPY